MWWGDNVMSIFKTYPQTKKANILKHKIQVLSFRDKDKVLEVIELLKIAVECTNNGAELEHLKCHLKGLCDG